TAQTSDALVSSRSLTATYPRVSSATPARPSPIPLDLVAFSAPAEATARSRCASGGRSPLVDRRRHRPRRRGAGEPIAGGPGWLHRLELLADVPQCSGCRADEVRESVAARVSDMVVC